MQKFKNVFVAILAVVLVVFFAGCSGNSDPQNTNNPQNPPSNSDSQTITEEDAKKYLGQTSSLILKAVSDLNSLSEYSKSEFQQNQMFGVETKIEEILNAALFLSDETEIVNNENLKPEKVYSNSSLTEDNFAKFSTDVNGNYVDFTQITKATAAGNKFVANAYKSNIENSAVVSVNFKGAKTDDDGKNLCLFGFEYSSKNSTLNLFYGKPSTSEDAVLYLFDFDYNDVVWDSYMICKFDFGQEATQKCAVRAGIKQSNFELVPEKMFQTVVTNAKFSEFALTYVNFTSLKDDAKVIENEKLFEKINKEYIEYIPSENIFKVV